MGDPISGTAALASTVGGGKTQPPPAPDYMGAARQQGASQFVNQNTPYGSLNYSSDPTSPSGYKSDISLNPQAQGALNSQLGLSQGLGQLAQGQLGNVQQQYSKPFDLSSVPQIENQAYGAMTSRLDPQWQQNEQMQKTQLANQGLVPGGEAYDNAMRVFNQGKNDAYQQATLGAIQTMPQTYQLAQSTYNQPLNQLNAIRSGAQIQNPQFQQFGQSPYLSAAGQAGQYAGDVYNQQIAQQNALTGGLFGLGGNLGAAALLSKAPMVAAGI